MIELNDESLKRYVDMIQSKDKSVVSLLCTILEKNFDFKYTALYYYLYFHADDNRDLLLNSEDSKLNAFLKKTFFKNLFITHSHVLYFTIDAYSTNRYDPKNIFTEEAQFMINKIIKEMLEYRLNLKKEQAKITIDINITLKQNE